MQADSNAVAARRRQKPIFEFISVYPLKQKKSFLLLEILIAIVIVSLCLAPLLQGPLQSFRSEVRLLEAMERERLADRTFLEIKEMLLQNKIAWKQLPTLNARVGPLPLPPASIHMPNRATPPLQRAFFLKCTSEKTGLKGEVYRMFKVTLHFTPPLPGFKDPTYQMMVRQLPAQDIP